VTLVTKHGRDAIEDVFIFVIDDMTLDIQEVNAAAESPSRRYRDRTLPRRRRRRRRSRPPPPPTKAATPRPAATPCASRPSAWTR
jgi:hypothetical protein